MAPAAELRDLFARATGLLFTEETVKAALDITVRMAHDVLSGTMGAGVTLIREGKRLSAAYSDEIVHRADALQYDLDEGPCLSAWSEVKVFRIDHMDSDVRWPRWAPAASGLGMRSAVSVPLVVQGRALGAIKAYSTQEAAFNESHERVMGRFADQAALVLGNVLAAEEAERLNVDLKDALKSRQVIAEAMGMLMERHHVSEEDAFTLLRAAAVEQGNGIRLTAELLIRGIARGQNPEKRRRRG